MAHASEPETWAAIPNWPGYSVSTNGAVHGPSGKALRPSSLNSGYLGIKLRSGGKARGTTVHAILLEAHVGPRPSRRHVANHKNGNKQDNRLDNLEWVTNSENILHARDVLGTFKGRPKTAVKLHHLVPELRMKIAIEIFDDGRKASVLEFRRTRRIDTFNVTQDGKAIGEMSISSVAAHIRKLLPRKKSPRNKQ